MSSVNFRKILLNKIKLDSCKVHHFAESFEKLLDNNYMTCDNCGGEINYTQVNQYMRGYIAAGGNPSEVWAEFMGDQVELSARCPKLALDDKHEDDCELCNGSNFIPVSKIREYFSKIELT